jgi:hypothetical protein
VRRRAAAHPALAHNTAGRERRALRRRARGRRREIQQLRKKKPVVATMGDVAASGRPAWLLITLP